MGLLTKKMQGNRLLCECTECQSRIMILDWGQRKVWEVAPTIIDRHAETGPKPLVTGDDLIQAGFKPGPWMRFGLEAAMELQQTGEENHGVLMGAAVAAIFANT